MILLFLSLIAGALLPLAFAPFKIYGLAFLCPAFLCYFWLNSTSIQAFWRGLFFGLGFFTVGASWVFISIHTFGNAGIILSAFITTLFIVVLAAFPATQGLMMRLFFPHKSEAVQCLFIFPAFYTLWEFFRSHFLSGFPWLLLGNSQLQTPLNGYTPILGVYGVTLIVTLFAGGLALLFSSHNGKIKIYTVGMILFLAAFGWLFSGYSWTQAAGPALRVSLIQGNIAQTIKWDQKHLLNILNTYRQMTDKAWQSDLIIWPEAAIPIFPDQIQEYISYIDDQAKNHRRYLLTGIPIYHTDTKEYFNAIMLLGSSQGIYLKRHLVPFGEYLPLSFLFSWLLNYWQIPMSEFTPGPKIQPPLKINSYAIAPFICYETAFPTEVLKAAKNKNILVAVVDDSWFGDSIALWQHLEISQMRALETGRYLLQATNTGVTAIINTQGKIASEAPINVPYILTADITPMKGRTPLMIWQYYPIIALLVLFLLLGWML